MLIVFRDALLFGNLRLKRIISTVREDCHNSVAHVFNNKPLEGSDDRTDLFIIAITKSNTLRSILGFRSDERITFAGLLRRAHVDDREATERRSFSRWNVAKVMKSNSQRNLLAIALGPGESIRTSKPNKHTEHKTHQDKNPDKGEL